MAVVAGASDSAVDVRASRETRTRLMKLLKCLKLLLCDARACHGIGTLFKTTKLDEIDCQSNCTLSNCTLSKTEAVCSMRDPFHVVPLTELAT